MAQGRLWIDGMSFRRRARVLPGWEGQPARRTVDGVDKRIQWKLATLGSNCQTVGLTEAGFGGQVLDKLDKVVCQMLDPLDLALWESLLCAKRVSLQLGAVQSHTENQAGKVCCRLPISQIDGIRDCSSHEHQGQKASHPPTMRAHLGRSPHRLQLVQVKCLQALSKRVSLGLAAPILVLRLLARFWLWRRCRSLQRRSEWYETYTQKSNHNKN
jgi:hypothetical protein